VFVSGVDGCRAGWVAFEVEVPSLARSVKLVDVPTLLKSRPNDLLCLAIDIPIGLLDYSRACDKASAEAAGSAASYKCVRSTVSGGSHSNNSRRRKSDQSREDGQRT
jgi:predicted RNase H-like nuclease